MINLLLGAPGGGKSYEAVGFHVLPALQRGRKVITNLPLIVEAFCAIDPAYRDLIELREATLAKPPTDPQIKASRYPFSRSEAPTFVNRAFANPEDYQSTWRNDDGMGPLYVVDECHFAMPRGNTSQGVEEWFSMHRHYNCDVLLITQSSGKISAAIKDLVQVCYKVRKAVAFGKSTAYIRKVLDGVNGGEISVQQRDYKPSIYKLYRSHTQGTALAEQDADDVKPFIVKFRMMTRAVFILGFIACFAVYWTATHKEPPKVVQGQAWVNGKPPWLDKAAAEYKALPPGTFKDQPAPIPTAAASSPGQSNGYNSDDDPEPYASKGLHLTGRAAMGSKVIYTFAVSQNALVVNNITDSDLIKAGYKWKPFTDCSGSLIWHGKAQAITCDVPQVSMAGPAGVTAGATKTL